jgi:hypothetical protein
MRRRIAIWAVLAVIGLALAGGVTFAATRIAGAHIGLSSEPSGGVQLAPSHPVTVPSPPRRGDDGRGDD